METSKAARDEMLDLAHRLSGLDHRLWDTQSLCSRWRIRDVLAHLVAGADGAFGFAAVASGLVRHRFDYHGWVAADGQARGQQDPVLLLQGLQRVARTRDHTGPRGLMHVVVHGQDMCRPLRISRGLPLPHLAVAADVLAGDRLIVGARRRITGVTLIATDTAWRHGRGPEVSGPLEARVMMMAGRSVALDDLVGEGKSALEARL